MDYGVHRAPMWPFDGIFRVWKCQTGKIKIKSQAKKIQQKKKRKKNENENIFFFFLICWAERFVGHVVNEGGVVTCRLCVCVCPNVRIENKKTCSIITMQYYMRRITYLGKRSDCHKTIVESRINDEWWLHYHAIEFYSIQLTAENDSACAKCRRNMASFKS